MTLATNPDPTPAPESFQGVRADQLQRVIERSRSRHRVRLLFAITLLMTAGVSAAYVASTWTVKEDGSFMTHTIQRSDLRVTVTEQGLVESAENHQIKSKVRGWNTVLWVIDSGSMVQPGDELLRMEQLPIQEQIDERTKYAHWSRSGAERSAANLTRAELAVGEYQQGRYIAQQMELQNQLVIARSRLTNAENALKHEEQLAKSEYVSELAVEEKQFAVAQAKREVELKKTQLQVLEEFTYAEQLQTLNGNLASIKARHEANVERAEADASRRDRAVAELKHCVIKADRAGLVIHPNAAKWELGPIEAGSNVHKDQILLLMPDLNQMQVKIGIHESVVDRVTEGLTAQITLANQTISGRVSSVASVTRPAQWWTGNAVRYDSTVQLPNRENIRPGMSADVEILISEYHDVLTIPVAAIIEEDDSSYCWIQSRAGVERRLIELGDTNDVFSIVKSGLDEGDEVVLNPTALETQEDRIVEDLGASGTVSGQSPD